MVNTITPQSLITLAPSTSSCASASYPDECRTASIAAPAIAASFKQFKLNTFGAQAAAVAIQLFESGNFQYSKNHFPAPGRPGQGTRNMQSPAFNEKYAEYLATVPGSGITEEQVEAAKAKGPADVLELVNGDRWGFGSAAWFIGTQCSEDVRKGLDLGTQVGFERGLTECAGTEVTADRISGWRLVVKGGGGKW
ncbi:hypothetical protein CLAFUW4_02426 [Fulvia fulva]|uniref:Uncharacterized protein n=1 Tax=Passalora fulva TaxID=5499 RepID=A0A9Q8LA23_PASFU|nr:uncharacterized protein CLAFUR5_02416 [Fulvia fulva]KAK4631363.1 hypothetical protein CLAFUR4_02421 [Fulvia fulva]UJO13541.1 hypothetical protein CLAFUR5_02416 [Fulvia fulva]WPV11609.1 hypothetical protein CLAFUW4_02426 [Fulvia fulva]WPV26476.1 hypothetical protein CLAFUW7_02426 [Fulvia fulva]